MTARTITSPLSIPRSLFATLMFVMAYLTTITVHAQTTTYSNDPAVVTTTTGDMMSFGKDSEATLTGTIVDADDNWVLVSSSGREIRVELQDIELNAKSDDVFAHGMQVTVHGKMEGDYFGVPVMKARNITASKDALVTVAPH